MVNNPFAFQQYSLVKVIYLLIRFNKTKSFLWNTNNTDMNGINQQNTHTHTPYWENSEPPFWENFENYNYGVPLRQTKLHKLISLHDLNGMKKLITSSLRVHDRKDQTIS